MLDRRAFLAVSGFALLLPAALRAHHGWNWTSDEDFTLTGVIREVRLGNPHGVLKVEAADGLWTAEIGQPGRNASAGLTDAMLQAGVAVTLEGHRSKDPAERRMKAERVIIAGVRYDLYPDRS